VDPGGTIFEQRKLLQLIRLPWFRDAKIPGPWRAWLVTLLDPDIAAKVRGFLLQSMEANRAPKGSFARDQQDLQIAANRYFMQAWNVERRVALESAMQSMPSADVADDFILDRLRSSWARDRAPAQVQWTRLRQNGWRFAAVGLAGTVLLGAAVLRIPVSDWRTDYVPHTVVTHRNGIAGRLASIALTAPDSNGVQYLLFDLQKNRKPVSALLPVGGLRYNISITDRFSQTQKKFVNDGGPADPALLTSLQDLAAKTIADPAGQLTVMPGQSDTDNMLVFQFGNPARSVLVNQQGDANEQPQKPIQITSLGLVQAAQTTPGKVEITADYAISGYINGRQLFLDAQAFDLSGKQLPMGVTRGEITGPSGRTNIEIENRAATPEQSQKLDICVVEKPAKSGKTWKPVKRDCRSFAQSLKWDAAPAPTNLTFEGKLTKQDYSANRIMISLDYRINGDIRGRQLLFHARAMQSNGDWLALWSSPVRNASGIATFEGKSGVLSTTQSLQVCLVETTANSGPTLTSASLDCKQYPITGPPAPVTATPNSVTLTPGSMTQTIELKRAGNPTRFTITNDSWLSVTASAATIPTTIEVTAKAPGTLRGIITISPLTSGEWPPLEITVISTPKSSFLPNGNPYFLHPNTDAWTGLWVNGDPNTRSITRVQILGTGSTFSIQVWGKCEPTDCDWGIQKATIDQKAAVDLETPFTLTWNQDFAARTQRLTFLSDGRLRVTTNTHFTDKSGRADYNSTEYFQKSVQETQYPSQPQKQQQQMPAPKAKK
jgi:hypothetical protein